MKFIAPGFDAAGLGLQRPFGEWATYILRDDEGTQREREEWRDVECHLVELKEDLGNLLILHSLGYSWRASQPGRINRAASHFYYI